MLNKIQEKISFKYLLLFAVIVIYFLVFLFNFDSFLLLVKNLYGLFLKLLPTLFLIFILMFVFNLLFDAKYISKHLGHNSGVKAWVISIVTGIISSGPIYMWYPLLSQMKDKGMHEKFISVFLFNRSVKLPLLPIMIYYFGFKFTLIFNLYVILFSVFSGLAIDLFFKHNSNEDSNSLS